jgi:hypothetical protein
MWMGYVDVINESTKNGNQKLSEKIMDPYNENIQTYNLFNV